ncbi:MAG: CocE/NonD family hydrolase [Candidatus Obscuribacterales bacterium]|nr:CocE/NonD family hydrolase [Candidatus Obscuribacterales bacterium]
MSKTPSGRRRTPRRASRYAFELVKRTLKMPDGTRLATTIFMPIARRNNEKFPVLLELLPYRKDDTFVLLDYSTYAYFAKKGYITVKVDIRGTGGSSGPTPPREYSDAEINDAEEIIRQLAELPESNGNVAMWGISWSGFNSIQVAMRKPPQLKAIIPMHSSDDLYHDDLHYVDGVLHFDPYHIFINHELALPRTPRYEIDERYFRDRFNQTPWLFTYLANQRDGKFWREKSLMFQGYDKIDIPVYLLGGLLDGYRDTVVRLLEKLPGPVKADIGPGAHSSPDDAVPGPNFEWQDEVVDWLHPIMYQDSQARRPSRSKRKLTVFVRDGHAPNIDQEISPGKWRVVDWPVKGSRKKCFYPSQGGKLSSRPGKPGLDRMTSTAGSGTAIGWWWGDNTDDTRTDDAHGLCYNSAVLAQPLQIIGMPKAQLKVTCDSKLAHWAVRLEDVAPDGKVSLVTGALINGCHIEGRLPGRKLVPGESYDIDIPLHFTTWTFQPGHRIRLAVANAQFPMAWPSPGVVSSTLATDCRGTVLNLPTVPVGAGRKPTLPKPARKPVCPFANELALEEGQQPYERFVTRTGGNTIFQHTSRSAYRVRRRNFLVTTDNVWTTNDRDPSTSIYEGNAQTEIVTAKRNVTLKTQILVESSTTEFVVTFTRELRVNGKRMRQKVWQQSFKRILH